MPLTSKWLNPEETILHFQYYGDVTLADLMQAREEHWRLQIAHPPYHRISDFRNVRVSFQMPQGTLGFIKREHPTNISEGHHVIIVPSYGLSLARPIVGIARSLRPQHAPKLFLSESFEEALAICEKMPQEK